jgi:hypothetical protein
MNIRIAGAYRTVSNEALCVITGLISIHIQIEEAAKLYERIKRQGNLLDREKEMKHWTHPASTMVIKDGQEDDKYKIDAFTDGNKTEREWD